jgi:hypothetical protein
MASRNELLAHLWTDVINGHLRDNALDNTIANCARNPGGPFSDTGPAIKRILDAGASPRDLRLVLRAAAYEAVFGTLYAMGDPGVDDNEVFMLHEDLLTADPSGMEGRPGSADTA